VRDFVPLREGHVSIYLCGATVQGQPHIGHVRSGVAFDILRRWLMASGYDVAFIRNVTDIDDKILNKAAAACRPWWEWAATYERAFTAAYDALIASGDLKPNDKVVLFNTGAGLKYTDMTAGAMHLKRPQEKKAALPSRTPVGGIITPQ